MDSKLYDVTVIGGGIVGLASAYKIQKAFPDLSVLVIEKETALAAHQTGHNSGVIHSGIYYTPGSYKAKNCVAGRRELVAFAREHHIAHDVCGKVIVATDRSELPFLEKIYNHGIQNEVEDVRKITAEEIREIEPFCTGIEGLWVGCTGIIDFVAVTNKLAELILQINSNSKICLGYEVTGFSSENEVNTIYTSRGAFSTRKMVLCGGLQSDKLALKQGVEIEEKIVGFRGDYYELTEAARHKVKNLIYPVPNPAFPFLGVHFTRMTNGEVECGPNAVFTFKREGYKKTDFSLKDTMDALSYAGTWKLFRDNWRFGLNEYYRAFSKQQFLKTLQRLIPSLTLDDLKPGRSGVRAMLLNKKGDTKDDFRIEYGHNSIHVLNAPSPAATASLSIGDAVCDMAKKAFFS
ncbi:L-2-hydroxyglutarate oxidase [Niabella insulamsoli]|uniref:L-2-hydroxyglutarate oxidase n=1 Tax=Niabella insulamsoli TaxID=3144874 RepID=UPI0031FC1738